VGVVFIDIIFGICGNAEVYVNARNQRDSMGLSLERSITDSKSSNTVQVDGDWGDLHVSQLKRRGKLFDFAVLSKEAATVKITPLPKSSFDVYVGIGSSVSFGELLEHLYLSFEFSSFDFRS
jgi:hypothetical protein